MDFFNLPTLLYHAVFSTKDQAPLITEAIQPLLYSYIEGVVEKEEGMIVQAGGKPDHIHLFAHFSPERSMEEMIVKIKTSSSNWINTKVTPGVPFAWQESYAIFSVSQVSAPELIDYIRNQAEYHRHKTFKEEFIELLDEHEIEYDEKDLWD